MKVLKYRPARKLLSPHLLVVYLFWGTGSATIHATDALYTGFGPEINAYSRSSAALGANFTFGMEFGTYYTTGLKTGFFHDLTTVSVWSFQLLFRYYLPWLRSYFPVNGPFVQAELGGILAYEYSETFPTFSAGISGGWRHSILRNWYIEPAVRFGYPHTWGFNITAGYRFRVRERNREFHRIERSDDPVGLPINLRIPPIYFNQNSADFEGLGAGLIDSNRYSLELITEILETFIHYRVIIEGHANPTTAEGPARIAEEASLRRVSEARAQWVFDELVNRGIDPNRLDTVGAGTSGIIIPITDYRNVWQNRRVVFTLIRDPLSGESNAE